MDRRHTCKKKFSVVLFLIFSLCLLSLNVLALDQDIDERAFLSPEQAFILTVDPINEKSKFTNFHFEIKPGYQLYQEHLAVKELSGKIIPLQAFTLPKPFVKKDPILGDSKIYKNKLDLILPLSEYKTHRGLKIQYQGCAEDGFCYPPMAKKIIFAKDGSPIITELSPDQFKSTHAIAVAPSPLANDNSASSEVASESDRISALLRDKNIFFTLLAFLGFGLLLAFTPCVLPMVPILANILVGQKQPLSKKRSFLLSASYVLSVAICYSLAGIAAGLLGNHLSTTLQQPVFLITLSIFLVIFALSQLSIVHIKPPKILTHLFNKLETTQHKEGSIIGAITMGAVSALVVSPCVTAPLVGALTYIGQTGDAFLGGFALFTLAIGMGLPLLIAACVGSHFLPKAGTWMVQIKNITGILLLGLAVFTFMKVVPTFQTLGYPTAGLNAPFTTVRSASELSKAISHARTLKKPVILDVYADWCMSCRQMDKEVFEDKAVLNTLSNVQLLRLDLTQQTKASEQLQKELNIIGPPMVLFFWSDGQEAKAYRLAGKSKSNHFIKLVNQFLAKATLRLSEEAR